MTPAEVGSLINRRGCYMRFKHDRQSDWDFLSEWEPSVVRIMLPGVFSDPASVSVEKIQRIHETVPGALILLRVWDVDDHNGDRHREMAADPSGFASQQIRWWAEVFDRIEGVPRWQLMAGLNNEVNVDKYGCELYDYTEAAMRKAYGIDMRLGVGMFSVGTPGKPGESPYDMTFYSGWKPAILAGNHALVVHEYEQPEGMYAVWTDDQGNERHDFENLINRHIHWPMKVPTIIGEGQLDGLIFNRHPDPGYGHSGWQNFPALWTPTRYADEYVERCKVADPSVISLCDFIWDPADKKWESFSPAPAAAELLARKDACEIDVGASSDSDHYVYIPVVIMDGPQIENGEEELDEPELTSSDFQRVMDFVLRWEGTELVTDSNGALCKFGINQAANPDIDVTSLDLAGAYDLYQSRYWRESGADKLPWPMNLAHMNAAVNTGVGQAQYFLERAGNSFGRYVLYQQSWYEQLADYDEYGEAWRNRMIDLVDTAVA